MKYYFWFFDLLAVLVIFVIQKSFVTVLPFPISSLNLLLVASLFVLVIFNLEKAVIWAVSLGVLMDTFSLLSFGAHSFALLASVFVVNILLVGFFTDRSLYSLLLLGISGSLVFWLVIMIFSLFSSIRSDGFWFAVRMEMVQIALNSIIIVFGFYLFNYFTRKLKPVFLIRKK